jgi:hypothetical protein
VFEQGVAGFSGRRIDFEMNQRLTFGLTWGLLIFAVPTAVAARTDPEILVEGQAVARDLSVRGSCEVRDHASARCVVVVQGWLEALDGTVALRDEPRSGLPGVRREGRLLVGGEPLLRPRTLQEGEAVQITGRLVVDLDTRRGWDGLLTHPGLGLRHPLLGESWLVHHSTIEVDVVPVGGPELRFQGAGVEVTGDARVEVQMPAEPDGSFGLRFRPPRGGPPQGPLAHGGPVVTLGGTLQATTPTLGLGYEVGLFEFLVLSAWLETDFSSLSEAVIVEAVTPGALFFVWPSLSAGVGLVASQAGALDPRFALRLRLSASTYAIGFVADFDYFPSPSEHWNVTLSARLSL